MKTTLTLFLLAVMGASLSAQFELPVTFEGEEEDTCWHQFANGDDDPANMVLADNPAIDGINTSDQCLMFVVQDNAAVYAGAWTEAYGSVIFTYDDYLMEMMVYKDKISNTGLKVEYGDGDPTNVYELKSENTKIGEWELLVFDFTEALGVDYARLTIFPDFPDERVGGGTEYIDNIGWYVGETFVRDAYGAEINVYPNPADRVLTVKYPGIERVAISNVTGQLIRTVDVNNLDFTRINVADLQTGVYFLTVDSELGTVSSKFVKR